MARNNNQFVIVQKSRKSNKVFLTFIGILLFVAILVPFFGSNLRYVTGTAFRTIFTSLGNFCLVVGGALLAITILQIFFRKLNVKSLLLSALLIWIGAFLTGVPFEFLGMMIGSEQPPQGYHFF